MLKEQVAQSREVFSKPVLPCVTQTRHLSLSLAGGSCVLLVDLPDKSQELACLLPTKIAPRLLGELYMTHLAWQLWRQEGACSLWVGTDQEAVVFGALTKKEAALHLKRLLGLSVYCQSCPVVLGVELAWAYLTKQDVFALWHKSGFGHTPQSSCHHVLWQTILGDTDPDVALKTALPLAAIYEPILKDKWENVCAK